MNIRIAGALLPILVCILAAAASEARVSNQPWVGSWSTSPQPTSAPETLENQTLRQIAHLTLGGDVIRLRISNLYGTSPVVITATQVGLRDQGANLVTGSAHAVLFQGAASVSIPAGTEIVSDPVQFTVAPQTDLAVSFFFAQPTVLSTFHAVSKQLAFVMDDGDFTAQEQFQASSTDESSYFLTGVDVQSSIAHAIVTFGDSITDGVGATLNQNADYPDDLAKRLNASKPSSALNPSFAVLNEGIGFNRILNVQTNAEQPSESGLSRFSRDVLSRSGVKALLLFEGINDIGLEPATTAAVQLSTELIDAYKKMAQLAHAQGIKVYMGTLTPIEQSGYDSPRNRQARQLVNTWIRSATEIDGFVDFDLAVRDSSNPETFRSGLVCTDHLHPSNAGYQSMANAIDLSKF